MSGRIYTEHEVITCTNCITEEIEDLTFHNGTVTDIVKTETRGNNFSFVGPGLIDLQVNGINGIDFNTPSLTPEDIVNATHYLLSGGVTTFLPTVVTNSDENILKIVRAIYQACVTNPIANECIWGIHLEGPFISPLDGAKGAHDKKYIKAPDWELFKTFQETAGGKIKLITIAPEWEDSCSFIRKCKDNGILVSIGHSMASTEQIRTAVEAGASLSTHLGNAVPLLLPRHPNLIWDQLATEGLYACIITDGIHIPDSFIKVVMKIKGKNTIVVSDATCFAGLAPGEYHNHIGGTVVLDKEKRVSLKNAHGLLAGAAKSLLENVETLIDHNLSTLGEAWEMASANAANMLGKNDKTFDNRNDLVMFQLNGKEMEIERVIKKGRIVFENRRFEQMKLQL